MSQEEEKKLFEEATKGRWQEALSDSCTDDWREKWFLDGEIGTVNVGEDGMTLTAGPEYKNNAHHMVLWTKDEFTGDLKIEYDWTRRDDRTGGVNILYIQATGSGEEGFGKDITTWNDKRTVPHMWMYFKNMNTYHISYAAFTGNATDSYIRGRRYMPHTKKLRGFTELVPEYTSNTLFAKGVKHDITVIKKDRVLFMKIENGQETMYCHMENINMPIITEGRIGLRHMYTRSSTYKNFSISTAAE